ncbi:hypothetical protein JCM14469_40320 [Desulfatiferula olefinivorans]
MSGLNDNTNNARPNVPVIGGVIGFDVDDAVSPGGQFPAALAETGVFLANGRSCLYVLLDMLRPERVWLPSYCCESLVDACVQAGIPVEFYALNRRLKLADTHAPDAVNAGDLVLVIDFFGFPGDDTIVEQAQRKKARLVKDAGMALPGYSPDDRFDFVFYSFRKNTGVPDGAVLAARDGQLCLRREPAETPSASWLKALLSMAHRTDFDKRGGTSADWFSLFREAEHAQRIGYTRISPLSRCILLGGTDFNRIAQARRRNYLVLLDELKEFALFPTLPDGVAPLGFPMMAANRDDTRRALFNESIFPPVHWDVSGFLPDRFTQSHALSACIMTLPCDQRYSSEQMAYMAGLVKHHAERCPE